MAGNRICAVIGNYDFSENADRLSQGISAYFKTIIVDSSSPNPPNTDHIIIPNTYYPGLWNAAVGYALEQDFEWLMFVASDLQITDIDHLCRCAIEATNHDKVGIYTPSVSPDSRCAFSVMFNRTLATIRECGLSEGFFFLARLSILKKLYPISEEYKFGWGIDMACCFEAYQQNKIVVADDRIMIHHPESKLEHSIDKSLALEENINICSPEILKWANDINSELSYEIRSLLKTSSLDIGCGQNPRNNFGADYLYGIDIININSDNVKKADLNIENIPFESESFDYVTATDFIEHVARMIYAPDLRFPFIELMNEIGRVLKPGGVFLSVTPAFPDIKAFQDPTHVNFITENTFYDYFCEPKLWAKMYGFSRKFQILNQYWDDGKLVTYLRALKQ